MTPSLIGTQEDNRSLLVLINPNSGRGKSLKVFKKHVIKIFESHKINYELFITTADNRVKNYFEQKSTGEILRYRAIIVVSGDGLVYELVNTVMARPDWREIMALPIGIIPTGSGNGLAHTLLSQSQARVKNQREAVEVCCQQSAQAETCLSDLVKISYNGGQKTVWSFLSIGWGLLADIDVDSDWLRRLGELRFTIYGLVRSLTSVSYRGRLSYRPAIDANIGGELNLESNSSEAMYFLDSNQSAGPPVLANSIASTETDTKSQQEVLNRVTGSQSDEWIHIEDKFACLYAVYQSHISRTTQFAPKSTLSDGLIYLTYVRGKPNPCQLVKFLLSIEDASHERLAFVKVVPVREFKFQPLESSKIVVDGEIIDWTISDGPLTAEVLSKAMKLVWSADKS